MSSLFALSVWSILIPAFFAIFKFTLLPDTLKPLAYNLWVGVVAEILNVVFIKLFENNLYVYNIFMLADFVTMFWLFNSWGAFKSYSIKIRQLFVTGFILLWVIDNFFIGHLGKNNFYFRLLYSLMLVVIAFNQLGGIYFKRDKDQYGKSYYAICIAFLLYYTFSSFIFILNNVDFFRPSPYLWEAITGIYIVINVTTNFIYALAFLWIQKKVNII